jgi:O-antigen/teichoic acid export membrane protein
LYISIFAVIGNNIINCLLITKTVKLNFKDLNFKRHYSGIKFAFVTTVSLSMYYSFDTVILGYMTNDTSVGYYTAAGKLAKIAVPVLTSFGVVLMPKIAKTFAEGDVLNFEALISKSFNYVMLISIPLSFGLFLLAPEVIYVISGAQFLPAVITMRILSAFPFIMGIGHLFGYQILTAIGKDKQMSNAIVTGLVFAIIGYICLIPFYQYNGAAIANCLAELLLTYLLYYYVKKHVKYKFDTSLALKAIISSTCFIPIIIYIHSLNLPPWWMLVISIIVCAIFYLTIQILLFKHPLAVVALESIKQKITRSREIHNRVNL